MRGNVSDICELLNRILIGILEKEHSKNRKMRLTGRGRHDRRHKVYILVQNHLTSQLSLLFSL